MSQSIVASNWTRQDANEEDDNAISLAVSMGTDMVPLAAVLPLTQRAGSDIPVRCTNDASRKRVS